MASTRRSYGVSAIYSYSAQLLDAAVICIYMAPSKYLVDNRLVQQQSQVEGSLGNVILNSFESKNRTAKQCCQHPLCSSRWYKAHAQLVAAPSRKIQTAYMGIHSEEKLLVISPLVKKPMKTRLLLIMKKQLSNNIEIIYAIQFLIPGLDQTNLEKPAEARPRAELSSISFDHCHHSSSHSSPKHRR